MVSKVFKTAGVLYLAYLSIVVLVVLPALNTLPHWYVRDTFGRQLGTDLVLFNPFAFSVEIRGATLPESDGSPFAAVGVARANLSLASLWQPGWVFDEILVDELYLHVRQIEAGRFNFSDMLDAIPSSPPAPDDDEGLPGLTVRQLDFAARRITLSDEARETVFSTHYDGLDISVQDLSTIVEEGKPYQVSAVAESGGRLNWTGTVSIPQSRSEGQLSLEQLSLAPFWRFAEPWLNFQLERGYLNLSGNYRVDWSEAFSYAIDTGQLAVRELDIAPKRPADLADTGFSLAALAVEGIAVDSEQQRVTIDAVKVQSPAIAGWMDEETISLQELFAVSLPETETEEQPASEDAQAGWTAEVGQLALTGGVVQWQSPFTEPRQLTVSPLEANFANLNWPLKGESPVGLSLSVNGEATLAIDGSLALDPGTGTLKYSLQQLPLAWFNPNFPAALKARITDGTARIEGEVTLAGFLPKVIGLSGAIDNFAGQTMGAENSLTSWNTVRLTDLLVDMEKRDIQLARILIDKYEGRVHILEDGSVNMSRVWQEEVGEEAAELVEELELNVPWKYSLPEIYVSNSAIDFKDESLPIPFRTVIGGLNGDILGIKSDPGAVASIDMKGSVDGYAPVVLAGTAAPLKQPPALDLTLTFNGVDLALLTPYSGTYAGYAIERGLLNLELQYTLDEQRLEGNNDVVISQLKLGEKVDSDKAVDLPLELALALLTDSNGVIDLEVPVSGNLDDPEFGLGSAIGKAFVNLITKAVTAPFTLLASLVGAEEDLQRLNFSSGSAELRDDTKAKLDQLTDALEERPGLTLIVSGRLNPEADLEHLQIAALNEELIGSGLTRAQIEKKDDAFIDALQERYKQLAPGTDLPALPQQYDVVRGSMTVSDSQLEALIEARAVAIKTYLVNEKGIAADKIAIEQSALDDEAHQFSGAELGLDA